MTTITYETETDEKTVDVFLVPAGHSADSFAATKGWRCVSGAKARAAKLNGDVVGFVSDKGLGPVACVKA